MLDKKKRFCNASQEWDGRIEAKKKYWSPCGFSNQWCYWFPLMSPSHELRDNSNKTYWDPLYFTVQLCCLFKIILRCVCRWGGKCNHTTFSSRNKISDYVVEESIFSYLFQFSFFRISILLGVRSYPFHWERFCVCVHETLSAVMCIYTYTYKIYSFRLLIFWMAKNYSNT